jgi:CRP-like cAMP-binding protein
MFGEMGILEGDARSATVTACIPTVCLKIDMSILDHPELKSKINQEQFCREVAQVTKNRLAKTTYRMAEVEIELSATKQKLQNAEEKRQETMKTLKKTLNLLDQKDSELSSFKQEMEVLKGKLQNPRE